MSEQASLFESVDEPARTFDAHLSELAKKQGMAQAADRKKSLLDFTRKGLIEMAKQRPDREVTADDAAKFLTSQRISPHALGNAAGSLFKGDGWEFTGKMVKSERSWEHSNLLKVWKLK